MFSGTLARTLVAAALALAAMEATAALRPERGPVLQSRALQLTGEQVVPRAAVDAVFASGPDLNDTAMDYIRGDAESPELITARALALIRAVAASPLGADPDRRHVAYEKIANGHRAAIAISPIMRVSVDRDYRPPTRAVGYDIGPDGSPVAPGFIAGGPASGVLAGVLIPIQRAGGDPLMHDGIIGARTATLPLEPERKRAILLTDSSGDPRTAAAPFGSEIWVNGRRMYIGDGTLRPWRRQSYLSNRGPNVASQSLTANAPLATTAQFSASATGGAVMFEFELTGPTMRIEFRHPPGRAMETYLVGMVVEPANGPNSLTETYDALLWGITPGDRLDLEALVAAAIREGNGGNGSQLNGRPPAQTVPLSPVAPFGPSPGFGGTGPVFGGNPASLSQ
ncbi:MAG: hypothetical protein AB7O45_00065 [Alphaproteobacteria bacterium]